MTAENKKKGRGDTPERFLSLKEVEYVTSLKKSTIYALVQSGDFPSQHPITLRRRAWLSSEVQGWMVARIVTGKIGFTSHD